MTRQTIKTIAALAAALLAAAPLGAQTRGREDWSSVLEYLRGHGRREKIEVLREMNTSALISIPNEPDIPELEYSVAKRDTLVVQDDSGNDIIIMKAIRDDETGEMIANEVLDAAVVTARFRNVAERGGKVNIEFAITVPEKMQDSEWQLRFYPDMYILEDSVRLDPLIITGDQYRKRQLLGYEQYERFLSRITDSLFIRQNLLETFLRRNIPEIYLFKTDSTEVSDERFYSFYGVSEQEAIRHYTNSFRVRLNQRRMARRQEMYDRYVKAPIVTEGIRLDTVIRAVNGDFIYNYIQTINTRPRLRKVDILLSGGIYEQDRQVYDIPRSDSLTFYISSLSSFVDQTERYLKTIIERQVAANASYHVDFEQGRSEVIPDLGSNAAEINRIQQNLADLLRNEVFDLDSIVVTASASPEGSYATNTALSQRRSESVSRYMQNYIRHYRDSLQRDRGFSVDLEGNIYRETLPDIQFVSRNSAENWALLDSLVRLDETLTDEQKSAYFAHASVADYDQREAAMRRDDYYRYVSERLYPALRSVVFDFHLHRKGMVQEQVETTTIDSTYMAGVQALRDRDYETAVTLLGPYQDFNAAVAYAACDRNLSAMLILQDEPKTAPVNYMMAILYARMDDEKNAVDYYLRSCRQDPTYVHRGNLDPEISALIRLYGLNAQPEEDEEEFDY